MFEWVQVCLCGIRWGSDLRISVLVREDLFGVGGRWSVGLGKGWLFLMG